MKKRAKKWIIIAIIFLVLCFGIYALFKIMNQGALTCVKANYVSSNPSLRPNFPDKKCCSGLVEISSGFVYDPDEESADENGCAIRWGAPAICSDCGNDNCEDWENRCNCPEDCL
jgi:hypothetical protein